MKIVLTGVMDKEMRKEIRNIHKDIAIPLPNITITVDLKNTMRGHGGWAKWNKRLIELNYRLLKENPEQVRIVYLHELAHIVAHARYRRGQGHNKNWKDIMISLGLDPDRCHDMNTSKLKRKRRSPDQIEADREAEEKKQEELLGYRVVEAISHKSLLKALVKFAKKNPGVINEVVNYGDGEYWIYFAPGWTNGYTDCHNIHEYTVADCISDLPAIRKCECESCTYELEKEQVDAEADLENEKHVIEWSALEREIA